MLDRGVKPEFLSQLCACLTQCSSVSCSPGATDLERAGVVLDKGGSLFPCVREDSVKTEETTEPGGPRAQCLHRGAAFNQTIETSVLFLKYSH